jgi:hypothetical protein
MKYGFACDMSPEPGMDTFSEFSMYMAELRRARRTPLDDHENLYPRGLLDASGAGSPPQ